MSRIGRVEEMEKFGPSTSPDDSWQADIDDQRTDEFERSHNSGIYHPHWQEACGDDDF